MTDSKSSIDGEVDLFEYIALLVRYRYRMVIAAVFAAMLVYGLTYLMPVRYSAFALVAYNNYDKPGGVALKEYRGGDTVSLLERDIIIDSSSENEKERLLARFRSYAFASYFIEKNDSLLKLIYPKGWDAEKNKWKDGFEVDTRKAVDIFSKELAWISADEKTGLLTVGFNAGATAAKMANTVVEDFKRYQKNLVLKQLDSRRKYLESRLTITANLEFQRSIYRMLEAQMSAETLARKAASSKVSCELHSKNFSLRVVTVGILVRTTSLGYNRNSLKQYGNINPHSPIFHIPSIKRYAV
jgi:uncharacterized protein involved in exopolysaccharide biosynthesis